MPQYAVPELPPIGRTVLVLEVGLSARTTTSCLAFEPPRLPPVGSLALSSTATLPTSGALAVTS